MSATPAPTNEPVDEVEASRAPLMDHLVELRKRLVASAWALGILFCAAWFVTDIGLNFLLTPLGDAACRAHPTQCGQLFEAQATAPLEMIFVKLKFAFILAVAAGFPFFAYQVYAFIAPGLYKKERAAIAPFLFVMPLLFIAGAALVYYSVLPIFMDLSFSQELIGTNVKAIFIPKVKEYYELAISLISCFGLAFQLPVVMSLMSRAGVIHASALRKGRKYAILIIFVVAAILTPPDPFSQFILAIPLCLLYESGIFCAVLIERGRKKQEDEDAAKEAEEERLEAIAEAKERAARTPTQAGE